MEWIKNENTPEGRPNESGFYWGVVVLVWPTITIVRFDATFDQFYPVSQEPFYWGSERLADAPDITAEMKVDIFEIINPDRDSLLLAYSEERPSMPDVSQREMPARRPIGLSPDGGRG